MRAPRRTSKRDSADYVLPELVSARPEPAGSSRFKLVQAGSSWFKRRVTSGGQISPSARFIIVVVVVVVGGGCFRLGRLDAILADFGRQVDSSRLLRRCGPVTQPARQLLRSSLIHLSCSQSSSPCARTQFGRSSVRREASWQRGRRALIAAKDKRAANSASDAPSCEQRAASCERANSQLAAGWTTLLAPALGARRPNGAQQLRQNVSNFFTPIALGQDDASAAAAAAAAPLAVVVVAATGPREPKGNRSELVVARRSLNYMATAGRAI